ncbi:MAG: DUF4350 domain-containing protein [Anaerolineae bacterium]|nr:DUF4350 domain-containing protein [Anaerolineae bacterium]
MKLQRDTWLVIGLLALLTLVTIAAGIRQNQQAEKPPYSSYSSQTDGVLALRQWMEAIGYEVLPDRLSIFSPPANARLIFVLEPSILEESEIAALDDWVRQGNTLIVSGVGAGTRLLAEHYQFSLEFANPAVEQVFLQNPLLNIPAVRESIGLQTNFSLASTRNDYVVHLADGARPVLASMRYGKGQIIFSSAPDLFSNQGLKESNAPEAVLNILRLAGKKGPVWFDEWHHGERGADTGISGPTQWLRNTPIGRALLFVAAVIFIGILLQGRLFGKPVPPRRDMRRRTPLEYIRAIANLGRRAGHRRPVMTQYYTALKRGLGKRYRLNPSLPNEEYVTLLGKYNPAIDQAALLELLTALQKHNPGEAEMVRLAAKTAEWLNE